MVIEEIAPNVFKIRNFANVFVYTGAIPMVIDTGKKINSEYVAREISKIIPLDKIKIVLLTHFHYDHCENVDLFPNAVVYAAKEEIEDYKISSGAFFHREEFSPESKDILMNKTVPVPLEINGIGAVHVPGHTRGCVIYVDKKNKLIFTGDMLFCVMIGRHDLPNSVPDKMKFSLEKIIQLIDEFDLQLCPGHDEF